MNNEEKKSYIPDDLIMTKRKYMNSTKENVGGGKLHHSDVGVSVILQLLYRSISTQSHTILRICHINSIVSFPLSF